MTRTDAHPSVPGRSEPHAERGALPEGYLPTGVAATGALTEDEVARALTADDRDALLERLGITDQDHEELSALIPRALAVPEVLAAITRTANLLRASAGLDAPAAPLADLAEAHSALQQQIAPGEGLIAILAHVVSTDTVRTWHAQRRLSEAQSWHVLSDLGQQMRVHRASSHGRLGLHQVSWTAMNWCGRLVHLGRLQFDLHRSAADRRWIIGVHIPATGPLNPADVEASFEAASAYFPEAYPDLVAAAPAGAAAFGREFECHSWLMNRVLVDSLGTDSNIGAFVDRFEILENSRDDDGAAFFVFSARPPYDPAALPRRSRLEREVGGRLGDGRGWESGRGHLVR
ncbi:acyltransferase domain-containing protein [Brachybacterium sp. NPDC056505]|uniref:acyltransferase domain-containing protein n=1 Tax=Brachybacterium sp. NPDC056505 TaxID=3345843 RepID=UPI00366F7B44